MLSACYGYRRDPVTGQSAMHSGLDFPGPLGTPILAAAPGKVVFVGRRSGYGNVVEVDHGQGILTRYAHLSGFTAKVGAQVTAGQQIRSEEHTSELQSLMRISYAVFCLEKKNNTKINTESQ